MGEWECVPVSVSVLRVRVRASCHWHIPSSSLLFFSFLLLLTGARLLHFVPRVSPILWQL